MADTAIRVNQLWKGYDIDVSEKRSDTLGQSVAHFSSAFVRLFKRRSETERIWALRDVTFSVDQGETIGIIGNNGAGKSTLLKILSKITEPTSGEAVLRGRVSSLLEVGTGFHSQLTGRENIYLNGAILGMPKRYIDRKFDEIVAFAELDKFIDTPVKHYSSGMWSRLGFAVAAHLDSEILLVDEALAVGDALFQKRCLGKMGEVAQEGRTILFVSHNMQAIQSLCQRAMLLDEGRLITMGEPREVTARYLNSDDALILKRRWDQFDTAPGNEEVRLQRAQIVIEDQDTKSGELTIHSPFKIEFQYWNLKPDSILSLTVLIYHQDGNLAFATMSLTDPKWSRRPLPQGLFQSVCYVPGDLLNDGTYLVEVKFVKNASVLVYRVPSVLIFKVEDEIRGEGEWFGKFSGAVRPRLRWETEHLSEVGIP